MACLELFEYFSIRLRVQSKNGYFRKDVVNLNLVKYFVKYLASKQSFRLFGIA